MYLNSGFFVNNDTGTSGSGQASESVPVDNKSARIIAKSGNILMHLLRNTGAVSLVFNLNLRVLYRLP